MGLAVIRREATPREHQAAIRREATLREAQAAIRREVAPPGAVIRRGDRAAMGMWT